ncbi:MAG: hypothetical protein HZB44_02885 [Actinobacteria bacterium]|nr:hypothetical protein [Actinomycetota bacterium]
MKASYKISLVAVLAMSLALVMILGASMGSAAAPDPQLTNDLVLMANGGAGANNIKVIDIDGMAVVNTIAGGTSLANNHDTILDSSGRYLWNTNNSLAAGKARVTKFDLGTLTEVGVYDTAAADMYAFTTGFCGIEYNQNNKASGEIWAASMSGVATNGGIYKFNEANPNGSPWVYMDVSAGTDSGQTCGIGWNASNTVAYASLMGAKKTTESSWPGGGVTRSVLETTPLHQLDVDKTNGIIYTTAGKDVTGMGYIDIIDASTMTLVNHLATGNPSQPHDAEIAHGGFMYVHSREGMPTEPKGVLMIFDIGGGTAGGTSINPVLIGTIPDQGTSTVSCGNETLVKSNYCAQPSLSISKNSVYWASYADYTAMKLSVDYSIGNAAGGTHAYAVELVGTVNTQGVILDTVTPMSIGNIPAGSSAPVTLKYNIPVGVAAFQSTAYATAKDLCNNTYEYPGAWPGGPLY